MRGLVLVNGARIRCTDSGGDGPAVVLLHGDWTDSALWAPLIPLLRDDFRVIGYDELAYGGSPPPTAAYTRLGNLRGLLVAPGAHDYPWPTDDPYFREFGQRTGGGLVELGLRTWAAASPPAGRRAAESGVTRIARAQFRRAVDAWDKTSVLCLDDPPVYERLDAVAAPTVVMVGENEYPMLDQVSRDIAGRITAAKLTVVPGADHLLPLRSPGAVAAAVRDVTG
jgi:3-oxoadipate enol-lactonase